MITSAEALVRNWRSMSGELSVQNLQEQPSNLFALMLDRATELKIAGNRPSGFADVTIAADAEGKITAFESNHWGTSGVSGGTVSLEKMPYVFKFENRTRMATGIRTNTGPQRSWRAPNDPQACALSQTAMDDVAAKLEMDSYDLFLKNLDKTPRPQSLCS